MVKNDTYITNIKAILIILVVIGHLIRGGIYSQESMRTAYIFIYSFHMPAFIFLTGYLSKSSIKSWSKVREKILFYLPLYLVFQVVYDIAQRLVSEEPTWEFTMLTPRYALWYLVCLIVWYMVIGSVTYVLSLKWLLGISLLIALVVGMNPQIGSEYSLSRIFVFFPFFVMGLLLQKEFLTYLKRWWIKALAVGIIIVNLLYAYGEKISTVTDVYYGNAGYAQMGISNLEGMIIRGQWYIHSMILIIAVLAVIPRKRIFLSFVGERTLQIYLIHAIICRIFFLKDTFKPYETEIGLIGFIGLALSLTMVFSSSRLSVIVDWPRKIRYTIQQMKKTR